MASNTDSLLEVHLQDPAADPLVFRFIQELRSVQWEARVSKAHAETLGKDGLADALATHYVQQVTGEEERVGHEAVRQRVRAEIERWEENTSQVAFYTFPNLGKALRNFSAVYAAEFESFGVCPLEPMIKTLKARRDRVCRFCGRSAVDTKFKKRAHAIPMLLGNKHLLSDSECDSCNEVFSGFENDLANFLGAVRSISQVATRKKALGFTADKQQLVIKQERVYGAEGTMIVRDGIDNEVFNYNYEQNRLDITFTKPPYVPLKVYKALLKMAMSVMPPEHISDYSRLLPLLISDPQNILARFAMVGMFESPIEVATPRYHISRKAQPESAACTHIVTLYFLQFIFSISIPLHAQDIANGLYTGEEYQLYTCPPLYPSDPITVTQTQCLFQWKDLAGVEPVKGEQSLTLNMPPDAFRNTHVYDPATGLSSPSTEVRPNIVKVFMTRGDERPDFPVGPFTNEQESNS